jgi:hypothetical protein
MSFRDRVRRVLVSERLIVALFQGPGQCVALRLDHPKLPADARVIGVRHCWDRQAFDVIVHSADFDRVPAGSEIPLFDDAGGLAECHLRYIDGDRITEEKPLAQKRTDAEFEIEAIKAGYGQSPLAAAIGPYRTFREMIQAFSLPAELLKDGVRNLPATVPLKDEAGNVIGTADVDQSGQAALKMQMSNAEAALKRPLENEFCRPGSPHGESSREWFQRIMSQTD